MVTNITGTFPVEEATQIALRGATPVIFAATSLKSLDDIANGMYDPGIHVFAEEQGNGRIWRFLPYHNVEVDMPSKHSP